MKAIFISLFLALLSMFNAYADCREILQRLRVRNSVTKTVLSEGESAFLVRVNRIEDISSKLRRLRKDKRPAIHIASTKALGKLDSYLLVGDYATAHRELRTLFRDVEFSALGIRALNAQLEQVRALGNLPFDEMASSLRTQDVALKEIRDEVLGRVNTVDGLVDELTNIRSQYEAKLGSRFQRYLLAREHLEEMLNPGSCSAHCQENVQRLLDTLGAKYASDRTRFPSFIAAGGDLSGDGIRELIDSHRIATWARLKHERNAELFAVMREFLTQPAVVQKIMDLITSIPGMHRLKLVRFFKMFLDSVAQQKHVPVINQIVRSLSASGEKLDQVLHHNGIFGGNEFMINFARRSDIETKRVWNEIVQSAGERSPELRTELLNIDTLARARGPLELLRKDTPLPRWAILVAGGAGVGYFWFSDDSAVVTDDDQSDDDEVIIYDSIPMEDADDGSVSVDSIPNQTDEPIYTEIPLEEEVDQELDAVASELVEPEVRQILIDDENDQSTVGALRIPNSEVSLWNKFLMWLTSIF